MQCRTNAYIHKVYEYCYALLALRQIRTELKIAVVRHPGLYPGYSVTFEGNTGQLTTVQSLYCNAFMINSNCHAKQNWSI